MQLKTTKIVAIIGILFFGILFITGCLNYPGRTYIYFVFSLIFNVLLILGFRRKRIFFDTFIGVFLWLGFWLKFTVRIIFTEGKFYNPIGKYFDYSGASYDHALLVASCGAGAFVLVTILREGFSFDYNNNHSQGLEGIAFYYWKYKKYIWCAFILLFMSIAISNVFFGIYQRGAVPKIILPYKLSSIFTWLLLFGLASISALILDLELKCKRSTTFGPTVLALCENFFSNVSILSRGMILNSGALAIGTWSSFKKLSIKPTKKYIIITVILFLFLFGSSIIAVTKVRNYKSHGYITPEVSTISTTVKHTYERIFILLIDRWIGIDGVIAVSSYPYLGQDLFKKALSENYSNHGTSFYDQEIVESYYTEIDLKNRHYVSLPGIIAFFYYPGSFIFLFVAIFFVGIIGTAIDIITYNLSGYNLILTSLLSQVVASRYMHFGYVPARSYLLFGAIVLTIILIWLANKILLQRQSPIFKKLMCKI